MPATLVSTFLGIMTLSRIILYPIKALDGVTRESVRITSGGILEGDRIYAIFDQEGRAVNGKRTARIHAIRTSFNDPFEEVTVWEQGSTDKARFALDAPEPFQEWLSDFLGFPVTLRHEDRRGFPDDTTASGPTLTSEASLRAVTEWFPGVDVEGARRRFRANLEIEAPEPFAEDRFFGPAGELKTFSIGDVKFQGHNPCQRCVVPSRDAETGEVIPKFVKTFSEKRETQLPAWSERSRFNHFYRFAVNTSIAPAEAGKIIRVGDPVVL